jgi:hypothetical protein
MSVIEYISEVTFGVIGYSEGEAWQVSFHCHVTTSSPFERSHACVVNSQEIGKTSGGTGRGPA